MSHSAAGPLRAFVGTLNRPAPYFRAANGPGLAVMAFDPITGALTRLQETGGIDNPSYLALGADDRTLYAVSEVYGWHEGVVTAYRVDSGTGALTYINKQATGGSVAAHCTVDPLGRFLFVANYRLGPDGARKPLAVVSFRIEADGGLGATAGSATHDGSGPNAARQECSHPHCAVTSPDGRHVVVADLGIDRVVSYAVHETTGALAKSGETAAPSGSGPRHAVFHPDGTRGYVTLELGSAAAAFAWDATTGIPGPLAVASALPDGWQGDNTASDLAIAPDGRYLYVANRGHDTVAIFALPNAGPAAPVLIGHHSTLGRTPRQMTLSPDGRFLLVCNQDSDTIAVLARNPETGALSDSGHRGEVGTPMCVKIASAPHWT